MHRSTGFTPGRGTRSGRRRCSATTDNGDGSGHGLAAGGYYYKLVAVDLAGNASTASGQSPVAVVSADAQLPRAAFTAPTPASGGGVSGSITLAVKATPPTVASSSVAYGFDAAGFRRSRTLNGVTTRYLLGGLIETDTGGVISGFDVDGPAGDLAHYTSAPSAAVNPTYSYYSAHGDLAAEANHAGVRSALHRYDPFGAPLAAPTGTGAGELFTGRFDKKHDLLTGLVEMGARPYDPTLGRFLAIDPIDGGSLNHYEYAGQDPINGYDLDGH